MANQVYANGREISCKAADGKSIAAFPDVCFTPPQTPATPPGVPIPYPNTGVSSDTSDGSKNVKISGKEIMMKDSSPFSKTSGNEAGSAPKKGVITSKNTGKAFFNSWSMDVKVEGSNVVRHLDLMTHNHGSKPGNTPPWMYADQQEFEKTNGKVCEKQKKKEKKACKKAKPHPGGGLDCSKAKGCAKAKACVLQAKKKDKAFCCHPDTTGHHLIEVHCFSVTGNRGKSLPGMEKYNQQDAPCACASQARSVGTHGIMHKVQGKIEGAYCQRGNVLKSWPGMGKKDRKTGIRGDAVSNWNYQQARDAGILAHKSAFPHCNSACTKQQLDEYHQDKCGIEDNTPLRSDPGASTRSAGELPPPQEENLKSVLDAIKNLTRATSRR